MLLTAYQPDLRSVGGSLFLTAMVSLLPLLTVFVLLGLLRVKAHLAGLAAVAVALAVAVLAFGMPVDLAFLAASEGAVYGLFPIMWIVLGAIFLYEITVVSGRFEDLRAAFNLVSEDFRIQGIIVAFCFGGLLEALAGFGAPVAITGVMLMSLGFAPMRAATTVLLANTAPVAFGAIAIPIITAGNLTDIPYTEIGAMVGRQTPFLAALVPLFLVFLVDGRRGVRETWPVALAAGVSFGIAQYVCSNFVSVELTDIVASLVALAVVVGVLRVWQPVGADGARERLRLDLEKEQALADSRSAGHAGTATTTRGAAAGGSRAEGAVGLAPPPGDERPALTPGRMAMAFLPYILVIVVFTIAKLNGAVKGFLVGNGTDDFGTDIKIHWPGLDGEVLNMAGTPSSSSVYTFSWLSSPGTLLVFTAVVVALIYKVSPRVVLAEFVRTVLKLKLAILTVASVLALAYVMNLSGQTITIGTWLAAGTGGFFAFLSPVLGWIGTAVTGSDTSANALFATLQQSAGIQAGIDPTLLVAANTSGGVVGKMISPQNLTIAATAVGMVGRESDIFRAVIKWSLGLLLALCVLVYLQSTVLSFMIP